MAPSQFVSNTYQRMAGIPAAFARAWALLRRQDAMGFEQSTRRNCAGTIGQLIAVLDDRNVLAAIRVLESDPERSARRVKCVGCGE